MAKAGTSTFYRRLLIAAVVFGLLILFETALFGWLIVDSLSKRELDRILLDTRQEASELARRLAEDAEEGRARQRAGGGEEGGGSAAGEPDLFRMMSDSDVTALIEEMLRDDELVQIVYVFDHEGQLVYRELGTVAGDPAEPGLTVDAGPELEIDDGGLETGIDVVERIGDVATLRMVLDRVELERRVGELRSELIRRVATIGGVTLALLLVAYFGTWLLLLRARRLEQQAAESERMAYVGTLAAGLAHEIRNPLNSLSLNMQMLEEEVADRRIEGSSSRLLSITRSEIERLERLATDFLSFARSRPLERREVPAVELLETACQGMAGELRARRVDVTVEDGAAGARVSVDPGQVQQLLINLLSNALAATEESPRAPRIVLRALARGGRVALEVEDNGIGMSAEDRERMFELFFSTRKGGTGLGLAIVERIARAHGAELEVESEPGVGTTVRLLLPAAEALRGE